jgi:hypothetical protein
VACARDGIAEVSAATANIFTKSGTAARLSKFGCWSLLIVDFVAKAMRWENQSNVATAAPIPKRTTSVNGQSNLIAAATRTYDASEAKKALRRQMGQ